MRRKDLVAALLASVLHGGEILIKELSPHPALDAELLPLSALQPATCSMPELCIMSYKNGRVMV